MGLSPMLVHCGLVELEMALEDRFRPGRYLEAENHGSAHSLGSILLLVAGFEAWLNESVATLFFADSTARGELVGLSTWEKYLKIPRMVNNAELTGSLELRTLLDLRNEIAHYLPFYVGIEDDPVPTRFAELQRRGLFIAATEGDFDFSQKLSSYKLAYWAWRTVETALKRFLGALGPKRSRIESTAQNFSDFRTISPPEELQVPGIQKAEVEPRGERRGRGQRGFSVSLAEGKANVRRKVA